MNRAAKRVRLFESSQDYIVLETLLLNTRIASGMRMLGYCVMPNHWHLILWPSSSGQLSQFMKRFTGDHAQVWQHARSAVGSGAVYQGRYKAIPIQTGTYFYNVCRYVERNPLRSNLVVRAEDWPWSSAWRRAHDEEGDLLDEWPIPYPGNWLDILNADVAPGEVEDIRSAIRRNEPLGDPEWVRTTRPQLPNL